MDGRTVNRKDERQLLSALYVHLDPIDWLVEAGQFTSRAPRQLTPGAQALAGQEQ